MTENNEKKYTILIVDDIPDEIAIINEILKKEYLVKAVTSGEAAIRIACGSNPPDLILLDIMMPEMDGFEVFRKIKQHVECAMIPVIFLTARIQDKDESAGLEMGAVDYIRKPVDPEIVRYRVRFHLDYRYEALKTSEIRYRRLFETSKDGILIIDAQTGTIIDTNPALAELLGVTQESFLGQNFSSISETIGLSSDSRTLQNDLIHPEIKQLRVLPVKRSNGSIFYADIYGSVYEVNKREYIQLYIHDITGRILAEQKMELLLKEKEELLHEIHHRVNNNLQIMNSLVGISCHEITDRYAQSKMGDFSRRIQTMSLIHQIFYESDNLSVIDFSNYIRKLVELHEMLAQESSRKISVKVNASTVYLSLSQAIPAGLIISELLSNSLKYSFDGSTILLSLRNEDKQLILEVVDNGIGLPDDFDYKASESIGMVLIHNLTDQLGGHFLFRKRDGGTMAVLEFRAV